jgi:hypothetical protein
MTTRSRYAALTIRTWDYLQREAPALCTNKCKCRFRLTLAIAMAAHYFHLTSYDWLSRGTNCAGPDGWNLLTRDQGEGSTKIGHEEHPRGLHYAYPPHGHRRLVKLRPHIITFSRV